MSAAITSPTFRWTWHFASRLPAVVVNFRRLFLAQTLNFLILSELKVYWVTVVTAFSLISSTAFWGCILYYHPSWWWSISPVFKPLGTLFATGCCLNLEPGGQAQFSVHLTVHLSKLQFPGKNDTRDGMKTHGCYSSLIHVVSSSATKTNQVGWTQNHKKYWRV